MRNVLFLTRPCDVKIVDGVFYVTSHSGDRELVRAMSIHDAKRKSERVQKILAAWDAEQNEKIVSIGSG